MTSRNKSFYRHSGSTKKRQPHYKIIRKAAEGDPSRTAPAHPGAFQERLAFYLSEQEEEFASVLAGSGFSFDLVLGGERIGFRRKSDRYTDDTMENVETVFLAFPQNGDKKRLLQGCLITLNGKTDGQEDNRIRFRDAAVTGYSLPSKGDVYHAQAAVRASRQLTPDGYNTYLAHVLYVHTPEKETYLMDEFDFDAHPLFMLGLLGNEYQLTAVRVGD